MIDSMPKYKAQISREGHNLEHSFEFTSSTGHLLTLFADLLNPDDTISGNINIFSRTNPINVPANVEVEQFIDYFFVPLEMIYSGLGDSLFLVNEPYSSMIKVQDDNTLPVVKFDSILQNLPRELGFVTSQRTQPAFVKFDQLDFYQKDSAFFSVYRNFFHNYINPNCLFYQEFRNLVNSNVTDKNLFSVLPVDIYQPNVLPLSLLAYNCVYEQFYRLDDREPFDNSIYNIDSQVFNNLDLYDESDEKFFSLKYRPYFFDYFTSAKVAPLLNPINLTVQQANSSWEQVNNYMNTLVPQTQNSSGTPNLNLSQSTTVGENRSSSSSALSIAQLRSMFAVEKIMSVTNRAKKTYDAQVLAHMGANVPRDVRHELHFLGTQRSSWKIGEVIATAGTSDTPLGDMAGKGYSTFSDNKIKFTAPCHGVFIGIYSSVPRMRYYAPLEKHMQISNRLDFWFEEYEKLGMQPIFHYEAFPILSDFANPDMTPKNNFFLGWQMRYQQYKQRFDKVSPAFIDTVYLDVTAPVEGSSDFDYKFKYGNFNTWQNWVLSKRPYNLEQSSLLNNNQFYASPTDLNNIMTVKYGWYLTGISDTFNDVPDYWKLARLEGSDFEGFTNNLASLFYRDPFIHFAKIDFKKVSKMSSNTLPDLNF